MYVPKVIFDRKRLELISQDHFTCVHVRAKRTTLHYHVKASKPLNKIYLARFVTQLLQGKPRVWFNTTVTSYTECVPSVL